MIVRDECGNGKSWTVVSAGEGNDCAGRVLLHRYLSIKVAPHF